ncbi:MAG TPA: biotin--[acetyl-CoA-carboxylase] ligase [Solirubrobacteraceae bacterium]|jgi:BirA family biotin operon repressor/biotin-[acetyl-CoA-carboxylase] ligase
MSYTPQATALQATALGRPRLHLRSTTSTNDRARELVIAGAPHGTLVTADEQTAGRGRMGRSWSAPPGSSLLMSLLLRDAPSPLPLLAAVAVCDVVGPEARVKWPNDIVIEEPGTSSAEGATLRKLAGILTEGRPQEGWAVLGIGLNVAVRIGDLPPELRGTAATLGLAPEAVEPTLAALLAALERRLAEPPPATLDAWRKLDALRGREVSWIEGEKQRYGRAEGIDDSGRLLVTTADGSSATLDAGEVLLVTSSCASSSGPAYGAS